MGRASKDQFDVTIVGGSAAGLYSALLLARTGRRVRVLERAPELNPVPRTLIATDHIRDLLGPLVETSIRNEIRRFELFADGKVATVELDTPDVIVERRELIANLANAARSEGVEISTNSRFTSLTHRGGSLEIEVSNNEDTGTRTLERTTTKILIGADGAFSKVAKVAGWAPQPTVPLVQAVVPLPADLHPSATRVWFRPNETPYFYWLIPEGNGRAALGLIGNNAPSCRKLLDAFLEEQGLDVLEYQAARIPRYRRWIPIRRKIGDSDVYLVGDAAGHVKVTTVGGLVTGFRGARAVVSSITRGRTSLETRRLRRELHRHLLMRNRLDRFGESDYARLISLIDGNARRELGTSSRDDALRAFLRLAKAEPRIILLALRGSGPGQKQGIVAPEPAENGS